MFTYHKVGNYFYNSEYKQITMEEYFKELSKFCEKSLDKDN